MPRLGTVSRRRRRSLVAAVSVAAVVGVGTAGLVIAGEARPAVIGGRAAAFLPPDGAVDWVGLPAGAVQREDRIAPGLAAMFAFPSMAQNMAVGGYSDEGMQWPHWVSYWGPGAGRADALPRDLYAISPEGIRHVMSTGFPLDTVYVPGLLVLPADVRPGATWTSEGRSVWAQDAAEGGGAALYDHVASFEAKEPIAPELLPHASDGCLETDSRLTIAAEGAEGLVFVQATLWCPGGGAVAAVGGLEGEAPTIVRPETGRTAGVSLAPARISWRNTAGWRDRCVPARSLDPVWGTSAFPVSPSTKPVVVGDAFAVADVNSADVTLLEEGPEGLVVRATVHPGGDPISLSAVGELLVVATSGRDLVAYSGTGERLWSISTPDLVAAPVVSDGGNGIVVAGLDGTVRLLDARTGTERWRSDASPDGFERLVVTEGRAIAADRVGGVFAVSLDDGSVEWSLEEKEETTALETDGTALLLARGSRVLRVDPANGAVLWNAPVGTGVEALETASGRLMVLTWRELLALDVEDGALAWRAEGGDLLTGDGASVVVAGSGGVRLIGADGVAVGRWALPAETLGSGRYLVAGRDAVWVFDTVTGTVRIGP